MVPPALRATFRTLSAVAPPLAIALGSRAFRRVGPPARVRSVDADVHAAARRGSLDVDGARIATYRWGPEDGPAVLLMHGWQLRASRFGFLVRDLAQAGHQVVAYDAPSHGESTGHRPTAVEHAATARAADAAHGPFVGVIGHSLGGLAAMVALRDGLRAERLVCVAAPTGFDSVAATYLELAGVPERLHERFVDAVARRTFPGIPDVRHTYDLCRNPVRGGVPALFVHDRDDRVHGAEQAQALQAAHPGSALLLTDGLGHNRVLDDEAVRRAVVDHLTRVAA